MIYTALWAGIRNGWVATNTVAATIGQTDAASREIVVRLLLRTALPPTSRLT